MVQTNAARRSLSRPFEPVGGTALTVTRSRRSNQGSGKRQRQVTDWVNAAQGLLIAVAALVGAVTTFVVEVVKS